jgi:hypothetical protein
MAMHDNLHGDKYWVKKVESLINEKKKYLQGKSKNDQITRNVRIINSFI